MNNLCASLNYNGKKFVFSPGTSNIDSVLEVSYECRRLSDFAEFAVLKLKNTGVENTKLISDVKSLDVRFSSSAAPTYHTLVGDDCGAESFMPVSIELNAPYHEEPFGGRSSSTTGFPFFDLEWESHAVVIGIGWTGQWSRDILPSAAGFSVQIGMCDSSFYLKPDEFVRLPSVLVVRGSNAAETRREFRKIMREHFSPKARLGENFQMPIAIQCFDRYFQAIGNSKKEDAWATENGQRQTVDAAKKLKYIDTLWLDAAWFYKGFPHGVGNFRFSEGFPRGLRPVSDYAHANGLKFIVWFEPERVYSGSDLYDQEKFLLMTDPQNKTRLFNLADESARRWLTDTLIGMIRDNGIDIYRQDFNMDPLPYWRANDDPNRRGITEMKYIDGLYRMWDDILNSCPGLWIDNCASGGRRLDVETAMRSVTLWRSDTGCFPEDSERRITVWNHNQILGLAEYLPYHACAVWDTDAYTVRSTATHGLAANFHILDPGFDFEQGSKVLREVCEMKSYWDGDFYPLTSATLDESVWSAYQLAFEDHGALYVFRRANSRQCTKKFALKAVDLSKNYSLTLIDEHFVRTQLTASGSELASGIEVTIPAPKNSLIMQYHTI